MLPVFAACIHLPGSFFVLKENISLLSTSSHQEHNLSSVHLFLVPTSSDSGSYSSSRLYPRTLQRMKETASSFYTSSPTSNPQVHLKRLITTLVHADLGFSLKKKKEKKKVVYFCYFQISDKSRNNEAASFILQTPQKDGQGAGDASFSCGGFILKQNEMPQVNDNLVSQGQGVGDIPSAPGRDEGNGSRINPSRGEAEQPSHKARTDICNRQHGAPAETQPLPGPRRLPGGGHSAQQITDRPSQLPFSITSFINTRKPVSRGRQCRFLQPWGRFSGGPGNTMSSVSISSQLWAAQHNQGPHWIRKVYFQEKQNWAVVKNRLLFQPSSTWHITKGPRHRCSQPREETWLAPEVFCKVELKIIKSI